MMWSRKAPLPARGAACGLRFACLNEWIDHSRCDESIYSFFPLNPRKPPPLCFGGAREGTVGDLSSRARRGTTPLAKHSERSVEHTPRIKHQALRSDQLSKLLRPNTWISSVRTHSSAHGSSSHAGEGLLVIMECGSAASDCRGIWRLEA